MKLHHSGFIVADIAKYERNMIFANKIKEVIDPVQNAKLALYTNFSDSYIELIEPLNAEAFTYNALQQKGNHFHHYCYQIDSVEEMNIIAKANNLLNIKGPLNAILFDDALVYFFYSRNKNIVEFVIL